MTDLVAFTFQFRWLAWGVGLFFLFALAFRRDRLALAAQEWEPAAEKHFGKWLAAICVAWFAIAAVAKWLQLRSLELNAQDFWLFVDVLEQMKHEGYMLSRFAPQGMGWLQHGAVHVFLPLLGAKPWVWLVGAKAVALLFNPAALALGGLQLGYLARRKWGAVNALIFTGAFLLSSYTGKILMYDMHPEALYPVLLFLWGTGMGLAARPARMPGWAVALAALAGMSLKEDSIFLFLPLFVHWAIHSRGPQRRSAIVSIALGLGAYALQLYLLKAFSTGKFGPQTWLGQEVIIPNGTIARAESLLARAGGPAAWALATLKFFVDRPFLSLLAITPWVATSSSFWSASVLLGALYVAAGDPARLWNYYSAPFMALFWFIAATVQPVHAHGVHGSGDAQNRRVRRETWVAWMMAASCLIGSGGISWSFPGEDARIIESDGRALGECAVKAAAASGKGVIAPPLLGAVSDEARSRAWTDRAPRTAEDWEKTRFVLISPALPRWEMGENEIRSVLDHLRGDPAWKRVGTDCHASSENPEGARTALYVKNASGQASP